MNDGSIKLMIETKEQILLLSSTKVWGEVIVKLCLLKCNERLYVILCNAVEKI